MSLPSGGPVNPTDIVPSRPTPHRPVVTLALALFLPALWLVLNGNLSVQTALVRFVGALFVSWVAAWLVLATVNHSTTSASHPKDDGPAPSAGVPGAAGRGDISGSGPGSADPDGTTGPGADAGGDPTTPAPPL